MSFWLRWVDIFKFDAERKIYAESLLGILWIKQKVDFVMRHIIAIEENMLNAIFDYLTDYHVDSDWS